MSLACSRCGSEIAPDDTRCPACGHDVVARAPDALLGRFHPMVADRLEGLLRHRGIGHARHDREHDVELRVDPGHRDALRAELATTWAQIVHALPEDRAVEVLASGGASPGWFDAPAGGWVDRAGRLVVDPAADDPTAVGTPRMAGPTVAGLGALVLLLGWYVGAGDAVLMVGGAMAIIGVLIPR